MKIVNIHDAKTHLSQLIEKVLKGEEIIIGKSGKPVAKLSRYDHPAQPRKFGIWKGKVKIAKDFDETPPWLMKAFTGRTH